ncbi:phosphotransferase [Spiroplasma sp. AdecLV25b]|uniref:phosphotransferase n=1 Tax=Spiroplasma sp. AdecLV25b TaxID=3027162 RepID=UPI0027E04D4A|nr:phosphotransferase [Spiroplasma sp. AdecLV25b]
MTFKTIKSPLQCEQLITKGLTNDLFLVNQQYFLKQSKNIKQPFLNTENQIRVVQLIQWQKFTLPIIEINIQDNKLLTLMPYYHDLITLVEQPIYDEILTTLSNLVKQLHKIKYDSNLNIMKWNGLEQLKSYCDLVICAVDLTKIKTSVTTWITNYQPEKIVLCHNDLSINNFVKTNNQWYLIDWDFTCWNDPLFDIASFASETLTNDSDIKIWFACFNLTDEQITIVKQWMTYQDLIWYYWACYLYKQTNISIYQDISNSKLEKLMLYSDNLNIII